MRTNTTGERLLTGSTFLTEISLPVVAEIHYGACLAHGVMSRFGGAEKQMSLLEVIDRLH